MAREAMNKVRYRQFANKCRGAQVNKVVINREDRKAQVLFRYNARAMKGGKRFNAEWVVDKKDRAEDDIKKLENGFLDTVRKDFMISKGAGFTASAEEASDKTAEENTDASKEDSKSEATSA
jgi:hypothetical protein